MENNKLKENMGEKYKRIGLFTYKQLKEDEYEFCLDVPIKFTKKQQREFKEYVTSIFGENSEFEIVGEDFMAPKKFIVKKLK